MTRAVPECMPCLAEALAGVTVDGAHITAREAEVALLLVGRGLSMPEAAATLVISPKTVETHATHLRAKLGLVGRSGLGSWSAVGVRVRPRGGAPRLRARGGGVMTTSRVRQDNTGYDKQRLVAAALDALAPRAVAVARTPRAAPDRCPRCNGSVVADRDVDGYLEAYCVACAWRAGALTAEQAATLRAEVDAREIGPGRKRTRRGRQANGVKL